MHSTAIFHVICHMTARSQIIFPFGLTCHVASAPKQLALLHSAQSRSSTHPRFKYVGSQADAYQQCLMAELLMHLVPLLTAGIDVDNVVTILIKCMLNAAQHTLPKKHKRSGNNTFPMNPWFDAECKAA